MKWGEWLDSWNMTAIRIKSPFIDMEWNPKNEDRDAAWELYTELLTRITTQDLPVEYGDEKTALKSVFKIFGLTRDTIKTHGRGCIEFTKIAIVILNQIVRPFTAKWHRCSVSGGFSDEKNCKKFRIELEELQGKLRIYTKMLSDMAGVEDLTDIEDI